MVTAERGMTCLSRQTAGADGYCRRGYDLPVEGGRQQALVVTAEGGMTCLSREADSRRWWLLQKGV